MSEISRRFFFFTGKAHIFNFCTVLLNFYAALEEHFCFLRSHRKRGSIKKYTCIAARIFFTTDIYRILYVGRRIFLFFNICINIGKNIKFLHFCLTYILYTYYLQKSNQLTYYKHTNKMKADKSSSLLSPRSDVRRGVR